MRARGLEGVHRRRSARTTRPRSRCRAGARPGRARLHARPGPTGCGSPTSRTCRPGRASSTSRSSLDAFSRRIVGWSMADHLRTELVLDALDMAIGRRRPAAGLIHHSDHGTQYTSLAFGRRCREAGITPSMGSTGDCYDNAMAESFFATPRVRAHRPLRAAAPGPRPGWPCSTTSRPSTTATAATPRSATSAPRSSRGGTVRRPPLPNGHRPRKRGNFTRRSKKGSAQTSNSGIARQR